MVKRPWMWLPCERHLTIWHDGWDGRRSGRQKGFSPLPLINMARAIRRISIERGHDLSPVALCCFGGAGGQHHAYRVADRLGIGTVFLHLLAGVLSAYGMGLAELWALRERTLEELLGRAATESVIESAVVELTAAGKPT